MAPAAGKKETIPRKNENDDGDHATNLDRVCEAVDRPRTATYTRALLIICRRLSTGRAETFLWHFSFLFLSFASHPPRTFPFSFFLSIPSLFFFFQTILDLVLTYTRQTRSMNNVTELRQFYMDDIILLNILW